MISAIVFLQNLRWLLPTTFMIGAAPAYISIWGVWRVISAVLPGWVYVRGDDFMFSTYHRNLLFFFELLTGVELVFYGDLNAVNELPNGENCLYLSNHQATMDWVISSCVAIRRGSLGRVRYILKDGLKFLPFYGVYLGLHGSVFVKRAGKFRKDLAEKQLKRDATDNKPMWLVIFPEGTRYNPELVDVIADSKKFAIEQEHCSVAGQEPFEEVLYPRTRALQVCVEQLKGTIDCVYDVTIAYGSTYNFQKQQRLTAPSMQDFLMGCCQKVHINIARIPIKDVPSDTEELKKWLHSRYQIKDRLLKEFYSANSKEEARFPGSYIVKPLSLPEIMPSLFLWGGTFILFNSYNSSRDIYWKVGCGAACIGLLWSGIRY